MTVNNDRATNPLLDFTDLPRFAEIRPSTSARRWTCCWPTPRRA